MGEREHIFMYLFCIIDSYASSGTVSFHSVVVLIHIYVFECGECAIEFNFIERLSYASLCTWKQFQSEKKATFSTSRWVFVFKGDDFKYLPHQMYMMRLGEVRRNHIDPEDIFKQTFNLESNVKYISKSDSLC